MIIVLAVACGLLAVGFFAVLIKWRGLKKDLRQTGEKLAAISRIDTNEQLTTRTFDRDIVVLVGAINEVLVKSRDEHIEVARIESVLKRAITNISHDLRTPITSAKGFIQLLEGLWASPAGAGEGGQVYYAPNTLARTEKYLATIRGRLEALSALMDTLFAFTQAVEGNIQPAQVNVGNVLRNALSDNYAAFAERGFSVESHIPDAPHFAEADEEALKRVVQNLLVNACVHGRGFLRVTLEAGIITIENGLYAEAQIDTDQIFDRFYTADASRTHKHTGLGLAIARELTEKMGGAINAEITQEGFAIRVALRYNRKNNI